MRLSWMGNNLSQGACFLTIKGVCYFVHFVPSVQYIKSCIVMYTGI